MLRVAGGDGAPASFLGVDCPKKQVALFQPSGAVEDGAADQDRRVVAPKLFSFDALFTQDHSQASYSLKFPYLQEEKTVIRPMKRLRRDI